MAQNATGETAEIRADRRTLYRLLLQKILETPELLIELAKLEKTDFKTAFVAVDARIRELQ